ncbi:MAG: hypothetical protein J3Q66DRAFT_443983 [Benniella sp.]|nr:MAG: hypothetical protein J3Q66DRAFT_443983 [Benniella sp.]
MSTSTPLDHVLRSLPKRRTDFAIVFYLHLSSPPQRHPPQVKTKWSAALCSLSWLLLLWLFRPVSPRISRARFNCNIYPVLVFSDRDTGKYLAPNATQVTEGSPVYLVDGTFPWDVIPYDDKSPEMVFIGAKDTQGQLFLMDVIRPRRIADGQGRHSTGPSRQASKSVAP